MNYFILVISLFLISNAGAHSTIESGPEFEYPYYARAVYDAEKNEGKNEMMLLNSGIASLQLRLDMINRATESIELEYFIYEPDISGQIIITELIKKAREGVRVRLLIDKSITVIRFDEYYADELRNYGVEVRYYNRALDPSTAQFRNHRKLLSIDNKEAITGGRNIGVDYFDMSPTYNFHDRDVWVRGSIVKAMVDSFDAFWNSDRAVVPVVPYVPQYSRLHRDQRRLLAGKNRVHERRKEEARVFMIETEELVRLKREVARVGNTHLARKEIHACPAVTYVSDKPTGTFLRRLNSSSYKSEDRLLNRVLKARMGEARERVVMETPYFMVNSSFGETLDQLLQNKVDVTLLTNSLASTDAIYVSANFYRQIGDWITKGLRTYVHTSRFQGRELVDDQVRQSRYGIHSKTFVVDDDVFTIGTYNVDNRSDFYNTEMTIFCEGNRELTELLMDNINERIENAYRLTGDGETAVDREGNPADAFGGASPGTVRLMRSIRIPTQLLEFLM